MNLNRYILAFLFLQIPLVSVFAEGERLRISLSVDECRSMAFENSVAAVNAGLDVRAAQARKQEAFSKYFPSVSISAFSFYALDPFLEIGVTDILGHSDFTHNLQNIINAAAPQLGFDPVYSTLQKGVAATVSVIQPVYAGGRVAVGNRLASIGVEAAELQRKIAVRNTGREIESSYWQVVSLEEKLEALADAGKFLDTLCRDVDAALKAGLVTESDLLQVKLKKNEFESGLVRLRNGIRLAKMNLFNVIGQEFTPYLSMADDNLPYVDDISLSDSLPELLPPENYYVPEEEAVRSEEEYRLLDISVEAGKAEKRLALGEALPQVMVGASYGYNDMITRGSMNGAVFGMISIPITDWGGVSKKVKRLDFQLQKKENEREYLGKQLILQRHKLWSDLTASWEQLELAEESVGVAYDAMVRVRDNYRAGMVAVSDLLKIEMEYSQAVSVLLDRKIDYRNAVNAYVVDMDNNF